MNDITIRPFNKDDIKEIECRFAVYVPPALDERGRPSRDDWHVVKENVHLKDGSTVPNVHFIKNFPIQYHVTREAFRKHSSKKEWEELRKVQTFKTTRGRVLQEAAIQLGQRNFNGSLRRLSRSPYLYGTDIESTAIIKQKYRDKYVGEATPLTVAGFDTETDMIRGHGRINMATLSFKDRVFTAVTEEFVSGITGAREKLMKLWDKYMGEVAKKRGIKKWELEFVDSDLGVIRSCFQKAHEWSPDIIEVWNIDYDMTEMLKCIEGYGLDPKDFFSDPRLPKESRFFEYKRGQSQKKTEGGKITPIKPAARWHTVLAPAGFYFLDGMCAYRHLRNGQGEEPSYGLDAIMKKHIKRGKLDFDGLEETDGPDWHIAMQSKFPLEYVIYNVWDSIGMEELEEEITDLSVSLPLQAGPSDWRNFNSQPRRVCDELHFYVQKCDPPHVMGTTSDNMVEEEDKYVVSLSNWINNLAL